jgi:dienelactone hydrolase
MRKFHKVICLVGSTNHIWQERYRQVNRELCLAGYVVFSVSLFQTDVPNIEDYRDLLESIHFQKMDMSDVVVLIHRDAIGEHTKMELERCKKQGRPIVIFTTIDETVKRLRDILGEIKP